jgi:dUTP pyrophosphatase
VPQGETGDERVMYDAMMTRLRIPIQRLGAADLPLPDYHSPEAAGLDLPAAVTSPVTIEPGRFVRIPCGIAVAVPSGFEAQVRPRSGLASRHGVTVLNAPGTIDADYRGEIQVLLINHGEAPFVVDRGMRIAQLVVAPVAAVEWDVTEQLPVTSRGGGGFGHTGT